jgi:hypothetical protein
VITFVADPVPDVNGNACPTAMTGFGAGVIVRTGGAGVRVTAGAADGAGALEVVVDDVGAAAAEALRAVEAAVAVGLAVADRADWAAEALS